MFEGMKHFIQGFAIDDLEEKKHFVKILAFAIYVDHLSREEERKEAISFMDLAFNGEDVQFMTEELDAILKRFQNDITEYEKAKAETISFVVENERKDIAEILKVIFTSDHQIAASEQRVLDQLNNLLKK